MIEGEDRGVRFSDKTVNFVAPTERIRPLRDQIIVKPLPLRFSDTIKAEWRGEVVYGEVIACGPGCYPNIHNRGNKDGKPYRTVYQSRRFRATEVKVGDRVHLGGVDIGGYLFPRVWAEGGWCVIATEKDICGIEA